MKNIIVFVALIWWATPCISAQSEERFMIVPKGRGFELRLDGIPFYLKGVGGSYKLDVARQCGANIYRTWSANSIEDAQKHIDAAIQNQLYVMLGIWLGAVKDGYYENEQYKDKMRKLCVELARHFKDEPAIFAWTLGNEIDTRTMKTDGGGEAWKFINELATLMKSIDKRHLIGTVIMHNEKALNCIAAYAPELDFVGINSYAAISRVKSLIAKSNYRGPYVVSEYGPQGPWEVDKTQWGSPIEPNSEEKRKMYESAYRYAVSDDRCFGTFAFTWQGIRVERTPTWFNMFATNNIQGLPLNGEKTSSVEAMQRVWKEVKLRGTAPRIRKMVINDLKASDNVRIRSNEPMIIKLKVHDLDGDELSYYWEVLKGDEESETKVNVRPERIGSVINTKLPETTLCITDSGLYRIFVYVLDGTGYMATENIPIIVK